MYKRQDPDYRPAPVEHKDVFGVIFEQGRNEFKIDNSLLEKIVTEKKELPETLIPAIVKAAEE